MMMKKVCTKNLQSLKIVEVTALLKINRHTLYELINSGVISAYKCGKSYRITEEALESFITNNLVA